MPFLCRRRNLSKKKLLVASLICVLLLVSYQPSTEVIRNRKQLFCMIITSENELKKALEFFPIWLADCDNHTFITKISTKTYPKATQGERIEINYKETLNVLQPEGLFNDTYKELSIKIYRGFLDVYQNHNDYEWYLKADLDTFIFVDNLRKFLSKQKASVPISFGFNFKNKYQSGGAGYLLSKTALNRLGSELVPINKTCKDTGVEDADVGECLRRLNVSMGESIDGKRERFHVESMQNCFQGKHLGWLKDYSENVYLSGYDCCSDSSISFHRQTLREMRIMKEMWSSELAFNEYFDKSFQLISKSETVFERVLRKIRECYYFYM